MRHWISAGLSALAVVCVLSGPAFADPRSAKHTLRSAAALGLHSDLRPVGPVRYLAIKGRRGKLLDKRIYPSFTPRRCYAVVAVAPPGYQLFLYAGRKYGSVASKGNNDNPRRVARVGFCVASRNRIHLLFLTNGPTRVAYRIFAKTNHMQKEQEHAIRTMIYACLRQCDDKIDRCRRTRGRRCYRRYRSCRRECREAGRYRP